MWVFCGGMHRSGSTLQFQIAATLVEDAGIGKRIEWAKPDLFPHVRDKTADLSGLKVFKSHNCTEEIIAEFEKQNAVGVYIFRDIREVTASYMRKHSARFEAILKAGLIERSLENYHRWTALNGVLISKYEEVVLDLHNEVKRIASHIGVSLPDEHYHRISEDLALDNQIQRIKRFSRTTAKEARAGKSIFDPRTLLHLNHITSGTNGNWQNALSQEQIALIESKTANWLLRNGYKLSNPRSND
jgi:hypothetical protein